jgi:hypothetical protein
VERLLIKVGERRFLIGKACATFLGTLKKFYGKFCDQKGSGKL